MTYHKGEIMPLYTAVWFNNNTITSVTSLSDCVRVFSGANSRDFKHLDGLEFVSGTDRHGNRAVLQLDENVYNGLIFHLKSPKK